jgi:hypothetical protein
MANSTFFIQGCPTCGRRLLIRVEYLGKNVVCQHCQGQLVATDPASVQIDAVQNRSALLRRADELLQSVARQNAQSHPLNPR